MNEPFPFTVCNVRWEYTTSRALTGSVVPRAPRITGIESAEVDCGYCGGHFHAYKSSRGGPGTFVVFQEQLQVFCPSCGRSGAAEKPYPHNS